MYIPPSSFSHVADLYDQSLYVQAFRAATQIAPLQQWEGTAARMLAGRIAATVGAPKLGRKHHLNAYRHDPKDWEARYYYARMILRFRGALDTLKFLKHYDADQTLGAMDPQISSNWLALHATVLGQLRDFDGAEQWLAKAEKIGPVYERLR